MMEGKATYIDTVGLIQGMRSSSVNLFMYVAPKDDLDLAKMAELPLQLGLALMLNMPIVMIVQDGDVLPVKLRAVCDKIITVNYADKEGYQEIIKRGMQEFWEAKYGPRSDSGTVGEIRPTGHAEEGESR